MSFAECSDLWDVRKGDRRMSDKSNDRYDQGMKTRRAVLGEAHVDRAEASKTAFDAPFQQMIVEAAWGHVWSGNGLTARER